MKKSLLLFLSIWILAISGCIYIQITLFQAKEDVQITETVLYGDKSIAQGVTVRQKAKYGGYLHWDTTYQIGKEPQVKNESQFSQWNNLNDAPLISFGTVLTGVDEANGYPYSIDKKYYTGITYAYLELAKETPNGERAEKNIYLKDYMEYYPINVVINLPNEIHIDTGSFREMVPGTEAEVERDLLVKKLEEYFKIPVIDEEMRNIGLSKSEDGTVGGSHGSFVEGQDTFSFATAHTYTDTMCYFTFDTHTEQGNLIDTSQLSDGYGIYAFSYDSEKNSIDMESLKNVYPLDPSIHILNLESDAQNEHLLLFTRENTKCILTVIEIETMQIKQTLVLEKYTENDRNFENQQEIESIQNTENIENNVQVKFTEEYSPFFWMYDDFFVIQYQDTSFILVTKNETLDRYQVEYTIHLEKDNPLIATEELSLADSQFDWNGEELVMCGSVYQRENAFKECGFWVSVLDETGLVFLGKYDSSLNTGSYSDEEYDMFAKRYDIATDSYYYMYECHPRRQRQLDVNW